MSFSCQSHPSELARQMDCGGNQSRSEKLSDSSLEMDSIGFKSSRRGGGGEKGNFIGCYCGQTFIHM